MELFKISSETQNLIDNRQCIMYTSDKRILQYRKFNKVNYWTSNPKISDEQYVNDYITVNKVKHCHIPMLLNQFGLFAKQDIKIDTPLGLYIGDMFTYDEFLHVFKDQHFTNLMQFTTTNNKVIVIKPNTKNMILQYINDARDSYNDNIDKINVESQQISINKYPAILLYTIKNIKKKNQLFMSYGKNYWTNL